MYTITIYAVKKNGHKLINMLDEIMEVNLIAMCAIFSIYLPIQNIPTIECKKHKKNVINKNRGKK